MARNGLTTAAAALALTLGLFGCGEEPAGGPMVPPPGSPPPAAEVDLSKTTTKSDIPKGEMKVEGAPVPKAAAKPETKPEPKEKTETKPQPKAEPAPKGEPLQLEGPKAPKS